MKGKLIIGLLIVGIVLFGWIQFYYLPKMDAAVEQEQLEQLEPETHQFSRVLKYENSYMGAAGNTINLIVNLPMSEIPKTFEQDPETFRFTINYEKGIEEIGAARVKKAILYNSTAVFTLIKNMETVEFHFTDKTYTVTRERVINWFGEDISPFIDEQVFEEKVQQPILENEQLTEWFDAYTGGES
ncbi:DUF4825 domain-containing protein [Sporosarcina sp. FA9]|uniref:DUF4825 domain-containing protein n=1 Tax=Sporosarcina sp. FA9 TaxID=3413030 RepID=UPI003F65799B